MAFLSLFTTTTAAPYAWSLVLSGGVVVASIIPLGAARSQA
ncbi:MAG TPA: MAPEG family protein, partial [Prochlorococcaceae cyanobacterium Fu_MAG_50]|nr:MAPEG family protein [Prochlorococcaceae cyanobacterium Fu_MAG_50]